MIANILDMRYSESHKERTRLRVLGEAAAAIRTKGTERVSVAEVMAAAGLTHGGFYAHFESKDDLIAQAITHMFDAAYNDRFLRLTEGREPAAAIASYVDSYLSPLHRLERANGCPIPTLSGDLPNLSDHARQRFTDGTERVVAGLQAHYIAILNQLGRGDDMLGVVFRKAQNRIQDPAKLERLIKDLIGNETVDDPRRRREGRRLRGAAGEERGRHQVRRRPVLHAAGADLGDGRRDAARARTCGSATRPAAPAGSSSPRTTTSSATTRTSTPTRSATSARGCSPGGRSSTTPPGCAR